MKKAVVKKRVSPNYSLGSKKGWAKVSPKERSRRMSELVKQRWAKTSKRKRREHALKMRAGRKDS